jgi:multidrug efflux pump subunit AcrB
MAVNISAWSIRRPLPSVVLSLILLILGWTSFMGLPVTRMPATDLPIISVVVAQFGAGPSELEVQVTKYIEDSVSGIDGVRHILSRLSG